MSFPVKVHVFVYKYAEIFNGVCVPKVHKIALLVSICLFLDIEEVAFCKSEK